MITSKHLSLIPALGILAVLAAAVFSSANVPLRKQPAEGALSAESGEKKNENESLKSWSISTITPSPEYLSDSVSIIEDGVKGFLQKKEEILQKNSEQNYLYKNENSRGKTGGISKMSDSEIFEKMWPKEYRTELKKIENIMVRDGFLKEQDRNMLSSDEEMFAFYRTMFAYARTKGWIDDKSFSNFLRSLESDYPTIIGNERNSLRTSGKLEAYMPGNQRFFASKPIDMLVQDIIDGLGYVLLLAKPVHAAWVRTGDCYKDDMPFFPVPGPNLKAVCCNCGIKYEMTGGTCEPKFKEDCGELNIECNAGCAPPTNLGCLNLACATWPNAIWDPVTGTCGCG